MNVSLTPRLEELVRRKVASGLYNNASEVIRDALRLLVERDQEASEGRHGSAKEEVLARLSALEGPLRARGIASLALFGSIARGEERPDSDVDVLVDIRPDARFSLFDLGAVRNLLEDSLGREVDVTTRKGLAPAIAEQVLAEAEQVF